MHRLLGDLHKKWNQVLDPQYVTSMEEERSTEQLDLKSPELDENVLSPTRIKSLVAKTLKKVKFDKVMYLFALLAL